MTTNSLQQITVPFHNAELYIVEFNGQPYTPMKPIVDGMGLDWASQFVKLKQRFSTTIVEITIVASDGKERLMTCLPVKKLFGWLMTISPNKVKPELRETVIKYQQECDDVLWDYWTKGQAINPRSTKEESEPLTKAVNLLVAKTKHLNYSEAYKLVHQRFNVHHIDEIPYEAIPVAVEYVHHLIALYSIKHMQEVKALPYPQEVMQVAQQIDHQYKMGVYSSWFVRVQEGVVSVTPLPHGWYPFNVKEFTRHFNGVLNVLSGSDVLNQGGLFLEEEKRCK